MTQGDGTGSIPHGSVLVAFADAAGARDQKQLAQTRDDLLAALGPEATVDAAAVASNFVRMVRIADATGIPLGEGLEALSAEVRADLSLEPREPPSAPQC